MTIILTSGVVASIFTSVFGLITSNNTNKRLKSIEEFKVNNSIQAFRYTSLYNINIELNELPAISYNYLEQEEGGKYVQSQELLAKVVSEQTDRYHRLISVYFKAKPLFSQTYLETVERLIKQEKEESNLLVGSLYGDLVNQGDLKKLLLIRQDVEKYLQEAIVNQLENLIKAPNNV
ncbi:hypothetical protein ACSIGC_06830 [Tenacibaculum sp. ZS6-P6]|uniref:hypothetical protein n=1 Tax=Tenacibaculum sp. ZS6-P6 TaxID=3447503 RepID=UPI003F980C68